MNEWVKRSQIGHVRVTGMTPYELVFDLPVRFSVHFGPVSGLPIRCIRDDAGSLVWKSRTTIEVDGQDYNLQRSPAFSLSLNDYVFTVE